MCIDVVRMRINEPSQHGVKEPQLVRMRIDQAIFDSVSSPYAYTFLDIPSAVLRKATSTAAEANLDRVREQGGHRAE